MRFLRVLLPALLVISVAANAFMWLRWRRTRPIMTINGATISEKDVIDYLQQEKGPIVKKELVERLLIDQSARKNNVVPSQAEIDDAYNEEKELNPQFAQEIEVAPWFESEAKNRIRVQLEELRLRSKDVLVSDDDLKDEYNQHPGNYDTPDKARTNVAMVTDATHLTEIKRLMEQGINPSDIQRDYGGSVRFPGENYTVTVRRAFGATPPPNTLEGVVFSMKPNEVKQLPPGPKEQAQGIQGIVIRLIKIDPGHKNDWNDAKVKAKIRLNVASKRMEPLEELLTKIWAESQFESEEPGDKTYIENMLFPNRAKAQH